MNKILISVLIAVFLFLIAIYIFPVKLRKSENLVCSMVVVTACHTITGECRQFPNSCRVPDFWKIR